MGKTADLTLAKKRKKDEFYTQLVDIENELKHYKEHFKDKVVLCNCDDPRKSNFFKYFADNFEKLNLRAFDPDDMRAAYEKQNGFCPICKVNWKLSIAVLVLNAVIFGLLYSPIVTI